MFGLSAHIWCLLKIDLQVELDGQFHEVSWPTVAMNTNEVTAVITPASSQPLTGKLVCIGILPTRDTPHTPGLEMSHIIKIIPSYSCWNEILLKKPP